ncbi:hypothetical protein C5167_023972, partial [Papaver somniferum]
LMGEGTGDRLMEVLVVCGGGMYGGDEMNSLTLNVALKDLTGNRIGELSKEYLCIAPDSLAPSASLPPYGAVNKVNNKPRLSIGKLHLRFNKS